MLLRTQTSTRPPYNYYEVAMYGQWRACNGVLLRLIAYRRPPARVQETTWGSLEVLSVDNGSSPPRRRALRRAARPRRRGRRGAQRQRFPQHLQAAERARLLPQREPGAGGGRDAPGQRPAEPHHGARELDRPHERAAPVRAHGRGAGHGGAPRGQRRGIPRRVVHDQRERRRVRDAHGDHAQRQGHHVRHGHHGPVAAEAAQGELPPRPPEQGGRRPGLRRARRRV